jgi:hypothetical protein
MLTVVKHTHAAARTDTLLLVTCLVFIGMNGSILNSSSSSVSERLQMNHRRYVKCSSAPNPSRLGLQCMTSAPKSEDCKRNVLLCNAQRHVSIAWCGPSDLFVLNNITTYCSIIFENSIESTQFIKYFYEENWMWKHLHTESCHVHWHATDRLTPVSRFLPNADFARFCHKHHTSLVYTSCYQSCHLQIKL